MCRQLRDHFKGVGVKRLSAVDAEPRRSNQHEVGTTRPMRDQFLGQEQDQSFRTVYMWLGRDQDVVTTEGVATHYDARAHSMDRSPEWRLYYQSNTVTESMHEGDVLFLAMHQEGNLYFIVAPAGSTSERQLCWLFGLEPGGESFISRAVMEEEPELGFAASYILEELGFDFPPPDEERLDSIVEQFGDEFPNTRRLSETARHTALPKISARDDPDAALTSWLTHEEWLFRHIEKREATARLKLGFFDGDEVNVDAFLQYSLSVHNRRKSRMGYALEHHLEAIFREFDISYVRGAMTEDNHRPDFLFPSIHAYRSAPPAGSPRLTMLGVKSSCKDRWRQVLTEADKIERKHLLTLEPGISVSQTDQMANSNLQLVTPRQNHVSYTEYQRQRIWNLREFIHHVQTQAGGPVD